MSLLCDSVQTKVFKYSMYSSLRQKCMDVQNDDTLWRTRLDNLRLMEF